MRPRGNVGRMREAGVGYHFLTRLGLLTVVMRRPGNNCLSVCMTWRRTGDEDRREDPPWAPCAACRGRGHALAAVMARARRHRRLRRRCCSGLVVVAVVVALIRRVLAHAVILRAVVVCNILCICSRGVAARVGGSGTGRRAVLPRHHHPECGHRPHGHRLRSREAAAHICGRPVGYLCALMCRRAHAWRRDTHRRQRRARACDGACTSDAGAAMHMHCGCFVLVDIVPIVGDLDFL